MKTGYALLITALGISASAIHGNAQIARTRSAGPDAPPAGVSTNARFPYAGTWTGTRTMPVGSDAISFSFSVIDDNYTGVTLHPGGASSPQHSLTATSAGLTWEQPNSGGGTWVFHVRLAGPDSLAGTLVLRDAPANLMPAPVGSMVLTRVGVRARQGAPR